LRTLPPQSPFSKSLILGIALASNIGGMASPISSPQNLIALEYMNPPISWLGWFAVSIPVASCTILIIWLILLWSYRAGKGVTINPVRVNRDPWTGTQYYVAAVTILTIVLWCIESKLAWLLGDMGIIAIVPIVLFYGTGILRKSDWDHSPFSIGTRGLVSGSSGCTLTTLGPCSVPCNGWNRAGKSCTLVGSTG
jgi:phosphate transporter